jgi:hypothetical protein
MRDETITQNLIRLMKREVIKQQCWDSMAVKGRCIEVFYYCSNELIYRFLNLGYNKFKSKTNCTNYC